MTSLTAQDIIDGLTKSGGVLLWSIDLGCEQTTLSRAITAWRKGAPAREIIEAARALTQGGVPPQTVRGVTGMSASSAQDHRRAPDLSYADQRADAAHLAKWGHV